MNFNRKKSVYFKGTTIYNKVTLIINKKCDKRR